MTPEELLHHETGAVGGHIDDPPFSALPVGSEVPVEDGPRVPEVVDEFQGRRGDGGPLDGTGGRV